MCFQIRRLCCLRLSTVGLVVGWFNLINALLSAILMCVAFGSLDDLVQAIEDQVEDPSLDVGIRIAVTTAVAVCFTISVAHVIASSLLILGTVRERHLLLVPWLISFYIGMLFAVGFFIYMIYVAYVAGLPMGTTIGVSLATGVSLVFQCTIWNAIYSLFGEIRTRNDQQRQLLLPSTPVPQYGIME